jgi:hypothetical protein
MRMTRYGIYHRLRVDGFQIREHTLARVISRALGEPQNTRPIGGAGHRIYTELDYRKVVAYLRVHRLCGRDEGRHHARIVALQNEAVELLASHTRGFVWIADGEVEWGPNPPVAVLQGGVATCWPVWD